MACKCHQNVTFGHLHIPQQKTGQQPLKDIRLDFDMSYGSQPWARIPTCSSRPTIGQDTYSSYVVFKISQER